MDALPAFYDDLPACQAELWRRLVQGADGRRSAFHTPSLATVDAQSRPRLRTVVLRAADPEAGTLRFHCDGRSDKAAEIGANAAVALHVYDPTAKLQVRIEGEASIHSDDALADSAWSGALAMSRVCYGSEPAPGTVLDHGGGFALPEEDEAKTLGRENFRAVVIRIARLDFLYLDRRGHRRASWYRENDAWTGTWVAP